MKFLFLLALLLPSLSVTVAAASAASRSFTVTSVALDKSGRIRITPESSCDDDGPLLDINVDSLMRGRATLTYTHRGRSSSSTTTTIHQSSISTGKSHKNDASTAFLNIRGGAGTSPSSPPSSLSDSWKSLLSFSQGVFQDHVQPALADPEHKILKPIKAFLEQQAAAAAERRQSYQKHSNADETSPTSTAASASASNILQQPARILRLVIVALVLAQVFETTGILDAGANKKFFAAWEKHAQPHWEDLTYNVQDWTSNVRQWWKEARKTGTGLLSAATWSDPLLLSNSWKTQVSPKYQTAVGLGIGMVFSPLLWTVGEGLFFSGMGAYLVAEVVHQLLESQFWQEEQDEDNWFTFHVTEWELDIATTVRDLLETWRQTVRDTVQSGRQGRAGDNSSRYRYSYSRQQRPRDTGGLFPPHMRSGVIIGAVIGVLVGA
jgi:hypothetical protein